MTVRGNRIVASGTDIAGPAKEELDLCAGPPILARAFSGPKFVGVIDAIVVVSRSMGKTLETTCLLENHHESVFRSTAPSMFGPPCCMSFPSPSMQRSICEARVEIVRLKSTEVQRRIELSDQTKPAIFVGAIALDAKRH